MADGRIEIEVEVSGTQEAASNVTTFNRSLNTTAQVAQTAGQQMEGAGRKAGQVGQALGQVGGVLGRINPQMGAFGQVLGQVGGAMTGLTTAMGPVGLALGVITAAVGIASTAMAAFEEDTREAAAAAEEAETSIRDLAEAYRDMNQAQNIRAGLASRADISTVLSEQTDQITAQRRELERLLDPFEQYVELQATIGHEVTAQQLVRDKATGGGVIGQVEDAQRILELQRSIRDAESERLEIEENLARVGGTDATSLGRQTDTGLVFTPEQREASARVRREARGGRGRGARAGADPFSAESMAASSAREREFYLSNAEAIEADRQARADAEKERISELEDKREEFADAEKQRQREAMDIEEEKAEQRADLLEEAQREAREASEALKEDSMSVLQPVVKGIVGAVTDIATGAKSADEAFQGLLSSFLEMIAQEAALSAAKEFAEAIASFARYDIPGGALHLAAGAAWTAVAVAAGAASVAVAPSASAPAEPEGSQQQDRGQGDQTVVINYASPVITSGTYAELGTQMTGMINEGERRFGRRAA